MSRTIRVLRAAGLVSGLALGLGLWLPGTADAQPIQGPRDQACRDEAARRVFGEPNPRNLDPYVRGRQYWTACMARGKAPPPRGVRGERARRGQGR